MLRWCCGLIFLVACCAAPLQEPQARETVFIAQLIDIKSNGVWLVKLEQSDQTLSLSHEASLYENAPLGSRLYIKGTFATPGVILVSSLSILP